MGPRAGLDTMEKRTSLVPARNRTSAVQPVACRNTNRAIPAPQSLYSIYGNEKNVNKSKLLPCIDSYFLFLPLERGASVKCIMLLQYLNLLDRQ
jgi:hypothetical protein